MDSFVSNATWAKLKGQYDENQLIDLLYGVGEITMHADFASTLRTEIEPELADRLPSALPTRLRHARPIPVSSATARASHHCQPPVAASVTPMPSVLLPEILP